MVIAIALLPACTQQNETPPDRYEGQEVAFYSGGVVGGIGLGILAFIGMIFVSY